MFFTFWYIWQSYFYNCLLALVEYLKCLFRHADILAPYTKEEVTLLQRADLQTVKEISNRFYAAIYHMKYTPCFKSISFKSLANDYSLDERVKMIRKNTWHKTLVANNTIPSVDAMNLRSERLKFVLENTSLQLQHSKKDPTHHDWRYENGTLQCVRDSEKSNSEIAFMRKKALRKCSCKKSHCKNKICICVSENKTCSSLCQCIDCENQDIEEEENSSSEEEEAENLQENIDSDMDFEDGNIFDKMISDL